MPGFEEENDALIQSFLEHTFFRGWRENVPNWNRIELYMDQTCNLDCAYCYLAKYGDQLYPPQLRNPKAIVRNAGLLIDWLVENGFAPNIDIFSGEPTIHPEFYEIVRMINEKYKNADKRPPAIVVPTNYSFLMSEHLTKKVEDLIRESEIPIFLSASVDGKYMEQNRPFKTHPELDPRGDKFYQKLFEFNKKYGFGFHPMIYADYIDKWKLNFLWFQENFKDYRIPFWSIYLLEVRNPEWRPWQLREFGKFLKFLVYYTYYDILEGSKRKFVNFIYNLRGYNILNIFSTVGRGLGCSIQSMLYVRLGDLSIVPCHRTSYDQFILAKFVVENGKITGIKALNPELFITIFTLDSKNFPYCETCPIKHVCSHGCLGAQYEFTGDLFTPFPTLCQLELTKVTSIVQAMKEVGVYKDLYYRAHPDIQSDLKNIEMILEEIEDETRRGVQPKKGTVACPSGKPCF